MDPLKLRQILSQYGDIQMLYLAPEDPSAQIHHKKSGGFRGQEFSEGWLDEDTVRRIKDEFESMSGTPNGVGSMYTTHIPLIALNISVAAYFNKRHTERNLKTSYSITVQGVVDPRGVFADVCIGYPTSMSDDQVLEKSSLFQRANAGFYNGVWIVGGSGYPLMDWVLVPYTQQHLTWTQHSFNEKIGEMLRVAKNSCARLKGR